MQGRIAHLTKLGLISLLKAWRCYMVIAVAGIEKAWVCVCRCLLQVVGKN